MFILVLSIIPIKIISLSMNYENGQRCQCDCYSRDYCQQVFYCTWSEFLNKCHYLECIYEPQYNCQPKLTMYKCQWENSCQSVNYTCSQITEKSYCNFKLYHGFDCMWKESIGCTQFSCQYSDYCEFDRCSYQKGRCGEPFPLDCQLLTLDECEASDGKGKLCLVNDANKCSQYDAKINCTQFTDNQKYCRRLYEWCRWDNNVCRNKECEDVITEDDCDFIHIPSSTRLTACYWTGKSCKSADQDIANFTMNQCQKNTQFNYKWEDSKCKRCCENQLSLFILIIFQILFL